MMEEGSRQRKVKTRALEALPFKMTAVTRKGLLPPRSFSINSASGVPKNATPKEMHDPLHKTMVIPGLLMRVIDTPQFQRLRFVKQLGTSNMVFYTAAHSRFEHSIGVAHLAIKLLESIKKRQPYLNIDKRDVLCVGLAGLCHDLGHGPFSHLFDGEFVKDHDKYAHERTSVRMLEYLLEKEEIKLESYGLNPEVDLLFVKEMILGKRIKGGLANRKGRPPAKHFLYDIINNERSGLDVDKIDYIMRDSFYTGVATQMLEFERLALSARVLPDVNNPGEKHIAFPEKMLMDVWSIFSSRAMLHQTVYQHKVVRACDFMVRDIMRLASDHLKFTSSSNKKCTLAESVYDMSVFCQVTDAILDRIAISTEKELEPARNLLLRLRRRQMYKSCGHQSFPESNGWDKKKRQEQENKIQTALVEIAKKENLGPLAEDDIIVEIRQVNHGKGRGNPLDEIRFYEKQRRVDDYGPSVNSRYNVCESPNSALPLSPNNSSQSSFTSVTSTTMKQRTCRTLPLEEYKGCMIPPEMANNDVRVFAKLKSIRSTATKAFRRWCKSRGCSSPLQHNTQDGEEQELEDQEIAQINTEQGGPASHFVSHHERPPVENGCYESDRKKRRQETMNDLLNDGNSEEETEKTTQ